MKSEMCGRCFDLVDKVYPSNCKEKPEKRIGDPIGQYHCPYCGAMVIAGVPHPDMCDLCIRRIHPIMDK